MAFGQFQSLGGGPNWKKIATGAALVLATDVSVVIVGVGVYMSWEIVVPILGEAAITEYPWVVVFGSTVIALNYNGVQMMVEGIKGQ